MKKLMPEVIGQNYVNVIRGECSFLNVQFKTEHTVWKYIFSDNAMILTDLLLECLIFFIGMPQIF